MELCTKGALVIPTNRESYAVGGAPRLVVACSEGAQLFVGQDRSWIAVRQKVNAGILAVVPVHIREFGYVQFQNADSEAN